MGKTKSPSCLLISTCRLWYTHADASTLAQVYAYTHAQTQNFLSRSCTNSLLIHCSGADRVLKCATGGSGLESDKCIVCLIFYFNPVRTLLHYGLVRSFSHLHIPHVYHKQELPCTRMSMSCSNWYTLATH